MRPTTIFLVLLLVIVVVAFFAWGRVPGMLSARLTKEMGVKVSIDGIILGPRTIQVDDLVIGNVPGGVLQKAFSAEEIDVKAPVSRYLNKDIVIEEIHIDNIYLGLEFKNAKGTDGNWTQIMNNLQKSSPAPVEKETKRTLLIKKVVLTNINSDLVYLDDGKVRHLPRIDYMELNNISSEGGFPVDQLMNSVLGEMLKKVFIQQNLNNMLKDLLQQPSQQLDQYIQPFKRFLPLKKSDKVNEELCA